MTRTWATRTLSLALANLLAARLALLLAVPPGIVSPVWPPAGIALAGVLAWGNSVWPGVFVASFLANLHLDDPDPLRAVLLSATIAAGSTAQALVGAALVRRFVAFPKDLVAGVDVVRTVALGGPVACTIAPAVGTLALWWSGFVPSANLPFNAWTWWVGDTVGVLVVTGPLLLHLHDPATRRGRWVQVTLPLVVCLAAIVSVFLLIRHRDAKTAEAELRRRAEGVVSALETELAADLAVARAVVGLHRASREVTREEFAVFAKDLWPGPPGLAAVSWSERVTAAERASFEARHDLSVRERDAEGRLVRAGDRPHHVVVVHIEPDANEGALGFDLASEASRAEALWRARATGQVVATAPIDLVQNLGRAGVLLFAPWVTPEGELVGVATSVVRVDDAVEEALDELDLHGLDIEIHDETPGEESLRVYRGALDRADTERTGPSASAVLEVGGRRWVVSLHVTQASLAAERGWGAWALGAAGLAFAGLMGVFLLVLHGNTRQLAASNTRLEGEASARARAEEERSALLEHLRAAVRTRDEFLSIASHELRTPLTPLTLQLEAVRRMLRQGALDPVRHERAQRAVDVSALQVKRLTELVETLLDVSRIAAGRLALSLERTDLSALVDEVVRAGQVVSDPTPIYLSVPGPVEAVVDAPRVRQVVSNLVFNALKYAPGLPVSVSVSATASEARIEVADAGPGIDPKDHERIFARFERAASSRHYGGLGLGLYISRQIVEAHGGSIGVRSEPGQGATFTVLLPRQPVAAT